MKKSIIYLGFTLVLFSTTRGTSTITSLSNKVLNQNHNEIACITKKGQMLKKESIVNKEKFSNGRGDH